MSACPKCGSTYGYYEVWQVKQVLEFTFAGVSDGGGNGEGASRGGRRKYCRTCQKDITRYVNSFEELKQ